MTDTKGTTSIRKIVSKVKSRGRISDDRDVDVFQLVLDGLKELSLFKLPQKNMVKLPVDDLGRIQLPIDYLNFIAVGVPYLGKLYTFTREKSMVQTTDKTYSFEAKDTEYGEGEDIPDTYYFSYGHGGGVNDVYFTINERQHYIQLLGFKGTTATLHYVSSGIAANPEGVEIPAIAEEALIAYALWMETQYDMTIPLQERRERRSLYGEALKDINLLHMPTVSEIMDNYYSTLYATIKR